MAGETGELDAEIAGQKLSLKNVNINTIATVLGAGAAIFGCFLIYQHAGASSIESTALVQALKEQTQAIRENTCVSTYRGPVEQREQFCKQISR